MPGGEYTLTVSEEPEPLPARAAQVHRQPVPEAAPRQEARLQSVQSYGPGDEVAGRVQGRAAPTAARSSRSARRDHRQHRRPDLRRRRQGQRQAVRLPDRRRRAGAGALRAAREHRARRGQPVGEVRRRRSVETIVRPIPIVLKKLQVEFFPEGGDLVAGLPNRVYFQARTPLGKPAELKGTLRWTGERRWPSPLRPCTTTRSPASTRGWASSPSRRRPATSMRCRSTRPPASPSETPCRPCAMTAWC